MAGLFLFSGCSNDNDDETPPVIPVPQSFMLDNHNYSLLGFQGLTEIKMGGVYTIEGVNYDRSTITVTGMNGLTETGMVSFDLYYKTGTSMAGTYQIDDSLDDIDLFQNLLSAQERACMGWVSSGVIFNMGGGDPLNSRNPSGTVTVTVNSATNYTVGYTGNFKLYENGFDFVRNVPCSVAVTADAYIQETP